MTRDRERDDPDVEAHRSARRYDPRLSDGPQHVGGVVDGLSRNTPIRWHVLILSMLRRLHVQWGAPAETVEAELAGEGRRSHVSMVREAARRVGISKGMMQLDNSELRRIARWLADRVNTEATELDYYPDGWRRDREEILRATSTTWTPSRDPRPEREPGDDDEPPDTNDR